MTLFNVRQRKLITRLLLNKRGVVCAVWISFLIWGFYPFQKWTWWTLQCQAVHYAILPLNRSSNQLADFLDDSPGCSWFIQLPGGNPVTDNICIRIPPTVMVRLSYGLSRLKSNVLIQVNTLIMTNRLSHIQYITEVKCLYCSAFNFLVTFFFYKLRSLILP